MAVIDLAPTNLGKGAGPGSITIEGGWGEPSTLFSATSPPTFSDFSDFLGGCWVGRFHYPKAWDNLSTGSEPALREQVAAALVTRKFGWACRWGQIRWPPRRGAGVATEGITLYWPQELVRRVLVHYQSASVVS